MRYKLFSPILSLFAAVFLSGCITEYTPPYSEDEMEGLLVVEGIISNGETKITLSRSLGISSQSTLSTQRINEALVWVESENGERYEASQEVISGKYTLLVGELDPDTRYRLRISLDGEEYESEYRFPQRTPPIEEINFHQNGEKEPVQVRLNVLGKVDQSRYYLWSYEDIWETHAHQVATHYSGLPGEYENLYSFGYIAYDLHAHNNEERYVHPYDLDASTPPDSISPYYYCWKYGNSESLLLATNKQLTENALKDHVVYEIDLHDDRLTTLYYTKIKQYALSNTAYEYFDNLKKNADNTGSIFAPIPSEIRGNIICSSSPDVPVIGYIEVSEHTENEAFLECRYGLYILSHVCMISNDNSLDELYNISSSDLYNYYAFDIDMDAGIRWTSRECIDCLLQGGSKTRPDFWPNDHY